MRKMPAKLDAERLPGLGAAIREARGGVGMTLADLAQHARVHLSALSKVERGDRLPSLPVAVRVAAALSTSLDALVARAAELA